jgi:hypothetical protein
MASDFIVGSLDETQINLKDREGNTLCEIEAVDVIDCWISSRSVDNPDDWFIHFQSKFKQITGTSISKTNAVLLYRHACSLVESLKKSGIEESEQLEPSDTNPTSPSET